MISAYGPRYPDSEEPRVIGVRKSGFSRVLDMSQVGDILKAKMPIIVGHRMFRLLACIYRTFFGTLPETLEEFLSVIHKLFPRLVDTQYLFLHSLDYQGLLPPNMSLYDLLKMYSGNQFPLIWSMNVLGYMLKPSQVYPAGHKSKISISPVTDIIVLTSNFKARQRCFCFSSRRYRSMISG